MDGYGEEHGVCIPSGLQPAEEVYNDKMEAEGRFCKETQDGIWEATSANNFSQLKACEGDATGYMRRYCNVNGEWETPDTTDCRTKEVTDFAEKVSDVNSTADAVLLLNALIDIHNSQNHFHGGDLLLLSDIMLTVAATVASSEVDLINTSSYTQLFMEEMGYLFAPNLEQAWKHIQLVRFFIYLKILIPFAKKTPQCQSN
ncbi:latrophilin-like protein LAT-2 [Ptychodera flava]|uniref:latrophilin-like protein LAT-2 n=1 Tax=Ptychodera flava TaxID=63121 RepID=UPI003969DAA0